MGVEITIGSKESWFNPFFNHHLGSRLVNSKIRLSSHWKIGNIFITFWRFHKDEKTTQS